MDKTREKMLLSVTVGRSRYDMCKVGVVGVVGTKQKR